jgi:hypothetical protein
LEKHRFWTSEISYLCRALTRRTDCLSLVLAIESHASLSLF